jgi:tryptophan-rich sensory protein
MKTKSKINWFRLILSIFITEGAGIFGSFATASSVKTWYVTEVVKSKLNPPSWLFAPVWTILFLLMGISLYLIWQKKGDLFWFWTQLILNTIWSFLFFGFRSPTWAFYEIIILWITILVTIIKFNKVDKLASKLLYPYLAWVSFATFLNYSIMVLN